MDLWYVRGDNPKVRTSVFFPIIALIFLPACNSENSGGSTTTLPINSFIQKIAAVAQQGGSQPGDQIDSTAAECLAGTFTKTHCADGFQAEAGARVVQLDAGQLSGSYLSRLMDGGSTSAQWGTISWTPLGPYGKELPGNSGEETVYSTDNVSMSENALLFHFNENPGSTRFADSSGNGVIATCGGAGSSECPTSGVSGHFNSAVEIIEGSALTVPASEFQLSFGVFTFSTWVLPKKSTSSENNDPEYIFEKRQPSGTDLAAYLVSRESGGHLFCVRFVNAAGISSQKCASETPLADGTWHHLAFRFNQNSLDLFVDGVLMDSTAGNSIASANSSGTALVIGADSSSGNSYVGLLDEFAIFKRALSDVEIKAVFHRGAYALKVQIRSCMDQSCSANLFEGPDGTKATYFSEESNSPLSEPSFNLASPLTNRYFQYQVELSRASTDLPPPGFQLFTAGH